MSVFNVFVNGNLLCAALHANGVDASDVDVFDRFFAIETLPRSPIEARAVTNARTRAPLFVSLFLLL